MTTRQNISTGSKWEPIIGYSRAVKVGNTIHVSGTTATNSEGELVGIGDSYAQTKQIILNIEGLHLLTNLPNAGPVSCKATA